MNISLFGVPAAINSIKKIYQLSPGLSRRQRDVCHTSPLHAACQAPPCRMKHTHTHIYYKMFIIFSYLIYLNQKHKFNQKKIKGGFMNYLRRKQYTPLSSRKFTLLIDVDFRSLFDPEGNKWSDKRVQLVTAGERCAFCLFTLGAN